VSLFEKICLGALLNKSTINKEQTTTEVRFSNAKKKGYVNTVRVTTKARILVKPKICW
jgi:hypothetical protein